MDTFLAPHVGRVGGAATVLVNTSRAAMFVLKRVSMKKRINRKLKARTRGKGVSARAPATFKSEGPT